MAANNSRSFIEPPMQLEPGSLFGDPYIPVPQVCFAVAELTECDETGEVRIRVWRAVPVVAPSEHSSDGDDKEIVVENVVQTYTILVPYTAKVDGQEVRKVREETRQRIVPIRRRKYPPPVSSGKPPIEQTFTICVPYAELIPLRDGSTMTVTRSRLETRTRLVDPDAPAPELIPQLISNDWPVERTKCCFPHGEEISDADKLQRFANPTPVLLLRDTPSIPLYFSGILKPDAIIVFDQTSVK
jgi:hypothetical protein